MRGLKHVNIADLLKIFQPVASFTDAWIETLEDAENLEKEKSHLLQMRGLKHVLHDRKTQLRQSHLLQMRGLKQYQTFGK